MTATKTPDAYANPCALCDRPGGTILIETADGGAEVIMHESCFEDIGARWVLERLARIRADNEEVRA